MAALSQHTMHFVIRCYQTENEMHLGVHFSN